MKIDIDWARTLCSSLCVVSLCAAGCSSKSAAEDAQAPGSLHLPLVTTTAGTYRIAHARFAIVTRSALPVTTLDSDAADASATALDLTLTPGSYTARLADGWSLTHVEAGVESVVSAALITANPQEFQVASSKQTALTFRFTTDAGLIVVGNGSVGISIEVTPNTAAFACEVGRSFGCPTGQTCLLADSSGKGFCATPGSLPVDSPCSSEQCVPTAQCLRQDEAHPEQGTCRAFCDPTVTTFGCECSSLGLSNAHLGICAPPPAGSCDLLAQTGCAAGEACQYLGGSNGQCGNPGVTPDGEACAGETCLAGSQCFQGRCARFCDVAGVFSPGCFCIAVGTGNVGRCF